MRHYPKSSIIQFGSWITHSGWEDVFNIADVNNKTDYFISLTWQKIDYYFPTKLVKLTNTDKEWMTTNLKKLISQRQKAHNKNQIEVRDCLAKKIRLEIKDAKLKYKTKKIGDFNKTSTKNWYMHINKIINSVKSKMLNTANIPELADEKHEEVAFKINDHFANICKKYPALESHIVTDEKEDELPIKSCSEMDTFKMIKKFSKKALGPGDFPKKILQEFAVELLVSYTNIINCSLTSRVFPNAYKHAEITPIPKCNPPRSLTDLRPISKTPIGGKMIETKLVAELNKDVISKLDKDQYGNNKGCSATHYLIKLTDEAFKSTDKGEATTAITIDYSKAFDYVDHDVLIGKLKKLKVRGSVIKLIISFLSNRSHCTRFANNLSNYETITCGVPQGTVSGPRLFVIQIDGVKCDLVSNYKFVDDKTLCYTSSGNPTNVLQKVMKIEETETAKDKMIMNIKKCNIINFNFSNRNSPSENLELNGKIIKSCKKIQLLGVIITQDLKWKENTELICEKVDKRLFVLTILKRFNFSTQELIIAWTTLIRPVTEYVAPLWHSGLTNMDSKKIENLQKKALGMILGVEYIYSVRFYKVNNERLSYKDVLKKFDLISLAERREILTNNFTLQTLKKGLHNDLFQDRHFKSAVPYKLRILNRVNLTLDNAI